MLLLALGCFLLVQFDSTLGGYSPVDHQQGILDIEEFGARGGKLPVFLGETPPQYFFTKSFEQDLDTGLDYSGHYPIKQRTAALRGREYDVYFRLKSNAENKIVVVVSGSYGDRSENYFIEIPSGEALEISAKKFSKYDDLYFISMGSFECSLQIGDSERLLNDLVYVLPPTMRVDGSERKTGAEINDLSGQICHYVNNYDSCIDQVKNRVFIELEGLPGDVKECWLERVYYGTYTCAEIDGCLVDSNGQLLYPEGSRVKAPVYIINLYYPTSTTVLHEGASHHTVNCSVRSWCWREFYATTSNKNGNILHWWTLKKSIFSHLVNAEAPNEDISNFFEDVLFNGACGVVVCDQTRPQSGATCSTNPWLKWYVYTPGLRCNF